MTDDAEALARAFHETYERLAPSFGYETRRASAVPWEDVPSANRELMIAVAGDLLRRWPSVGDPAGPADDGGAVDDPDGGDGGDGGFDVDGRVAPA
jgi:hypothetical protein